MDGYSYFNIFDTKGIEYLMIIMFFLFLIPFWLILNKESSMVRQIKKVIGTLSLGLLKIPQGIYYSKNHTWAFLEKSGTAKIGLDDFIVHITGELSFDKFKNEGDSIKKGDLLAQIDKNGKKLQIYSPISGTIITANSELNKTPEIVNHDPYGKGWLYKIKPNNWKTETNEYFLAEEATDWSAKELLRFKDFIAESTTNFSTQPGTIILQEGGELSENVLEEMPNEIWQAFQKEFFSIKP